MMICISFYEILDVNKGLKILVILRLVSNPLFLITSNISAIVWPWQLIVSWA